MSENKYLQWMTSKTQSIYWHDSAIRAEQQEERRRRHDHQPLSD